VAKTDFSTMTLYHAVRQLGWLIDLGSHLASCVLVYIIAGSKNTLSEDRAAYLSN
jgi:hypothetical protein